MAITAAFLCPQHPFMLPSRLRLLHKRREWLRGRSVEGTGNTGFGGARVLLGFLGVAARGRCRCGDVHGHVIAADNAASSSGKNIASAGTIRKAAATWSLIRAGLSCKRLDATF